MDIADYANPTAFIESLVLNQADAFTEDDIYNIAKINSSVQCSEVLNIIKNLCESRFIVRIDGKFYPQRLLTHSC